VFSCNEINLIKLRGVLRAIKRKVVLRNLNGNVTDVAICRQCYFRFIVYTVSAAVKEFSKLIKK